MRATGYVSLSLHDPSLFMVSYIHAASDDGEKESQMFGMIGCAILTMLHELDRAGSLKADSQFQDLGLVMCMALKWSEEGQIDCDEEDTVWRHTIEAYARKGGIDLQSMPIHGAEELVDDVDQNIASETLGQAKADKWEWRKKVCCTLIIESSSQWIKLTYLLVQGVRGSTWYTETGERKAEPGWYPVRSHENALR